MLVVYRPLNTDTDSNCTDLVRELVLPMIPDSSVEATCFDSLLEVGGMVAVTEMNVWHMNFVFRFSAEGMASF
eukprot:2523932-Amphidinium_carterae.1